MYPQANSTSIMKKITIIVGATLIFFFWFAVVWGVQSLIKGDDEKIDGQVFSGESAGTSDSEPFVVNDNMKITGSLQVGDTNVLDLISAKGSGDMEKSSYDSTDNGKVDANKLDSGLAVTLLGSGAVGNAEFGYLNGATSSIQTQLDTKGIGNMLKSVYDSGYNSKIDADNLDSGISAALIGGGAISNTEFAYLDGVTSSIQTQLNSKGSGTGDMLKSVYDVANNSKIDADKLDSAIAATLIGGGTISNTEFAYLDSVNFNNTGNLHLTTLGLQAGDAVTTGADNTAVGYNALSAASTTANSTAVGSGALAVNTDPDNTAVGFNALTANTTGTQVVAMGSGALDANTEGERNIAIGYDALGANITADDNVAIGHSALVASDATSNRNTAVGNYSLDATTNGVWNTAVGYGTLGNGTGVDANTALGYLALSAATGDNNIGIGYQAGNGISSGGTNIIIGYDADAPTATSSNQLNIGNTIMGDLSNDYIAIGGTAIPTDAFLEINQNASGGVAHIELNPIATPPLTDVDMGDIYMDTDGVLYIRSTSAWAAANTAADFSELIVPEGFEKDTHDGVILYAGEIDGGDLIVINADGEYERSSKPYDSALAGVESGERGRFRLKTGSLERVEGQRQVGIVGHIQTNVSIENGPIRPGDSLTTSSTPGHAMKATKPGTIVGKALESFSGHSTGQTGMIEVLVNPGWFGGY